MKTVVVLLGSAAVGGGWLLRSPTVAVVVPMAALWLGHWWRVTGRSRAAESRRRVGIAEVDALIQHLKGGGSLRPPTGLDHQPGGEPTADHELMATTLRILSRRGGEALPSLERLSDTLRSAQAMEAEARAQAGQARASASVMAALPAVFVAVLAAVDPRLRAFYWSHPVGAACLAAATASSHLGWWFMQRLIGSVR